MSGYSDQSNCPNCGEIMNSYGDDKPFDHVSHECYHCGLTVYPKLEYLNLDELNEFRGNYDLEPLSELPEQDKNI